MGLVMISHNYLFCFPYQFYFHYPHPARFGWLYTLPTHVLQLILYPPNPIHFNFMLGITHLLLPQQSKDQANYRVRLLQLMQWGSSHEQLNFRQLCIYAPASYRVQLLPHTFLPIMYHPLHYFASLGPNSYRWKAPKCLPLSYFWGK